MPLNDQLLLAARSFLLDTAEIDEVRASLVDLTDEVARADPDERRLYGRLWDRLSEYDYAHIDGATLRRQVASLIGEAEPLAHVHLVTTITGSQPCTHATLPMHVRVSTRFAPDFAPSDFAPREREFRPRALAAQ